MNLASTQEVSILNPTHISLLILVPPILISFTDTKKRLNSFGIQTLLMIEHGPLLVDSTNNHLTALIGVRVV